MEPLVAAIDMGSNSFKLLVARSLPGGRLLPILRLKEPLPLLRGAPFTAATQLRAISALKNLTLALDPLPIQSLSLVATAAIRDAPNRSEFLAAIHAELGLHAHVVSGEEEARLVYLGVLQFLPVHEKSVLVVDIGGGSTEFVVGKQGRVMLATSLKLGHVSLTENFVKSGDLGGLRKFVREVIDKSGLVEQSVELGGFELAIGSSGTARSIGRVLARDSIDKEFRTETGFSRDELGCLVEKLGMGEPEKVRTLGFSRRRAEVIAAGSLLLLEIFDALGIGEMEVSDYGLAEGIVSEMIAKESVDYDWSANARWRSVVALAARFDGGNRMKSAVRGIEIARELFKGIKRCYELECRCVAPCSFDQKDLEYLEAALLLHNIGMMVGKKGYHKHSYRIIKNCGSLHGYGSEEIELVALLARHHRKKFLKHREGSLQEVPEEMRHKFRFLCVIIRLSLALQQLRGISFEGLEVLHTHGGFNVELRGVEDKVLSSGGVPLTSAFTEAELLLELGHFEKVFQQKISVSVLQSSY